MNQNWSNWSVILRTCPLSLVCLGFRVRLDSLDLYSILKVTGTCAACARGLHTTSHFGWHLFVHHHCNSEQKDRGHGESNIFRKFHMFQIYSSYDWKCFKNRTKQSDLAGSLSSPCSCLCQLFASSGLETSHGCLLQKNHFSLRIHENSPCSVSPCFELRSAFRCFQMLSDAFRYSSSVVL